MDTQSSRFKDTNVHSRNRAKNKNKTKLSNIVNKIMASKTGEECAVASDGEKSEEEPDNYNIYE